MRLFVFLALFLISVSSSFAQVTFSHQRGFYTEGFTLSLTADAGAEIRYTLNNSEPTIDSPLYDDGIPIQSRAGEPNGISMISQISTSYAPWAPPMDEVFKATVVRAAAFVDGERVGPIHTHTFFVTPEGTNRYTLPVISLVTDSLNLFGFEEGIYVLGKVFDEWRAKNPDVPESITTPANYTQSGEEWERPVHVEFFEPGGILGFAQDGGVRLNGSGARQLRLKSFRLYAKPSYGPDYYYYQFFPDKEMNRFKRFLLRNSGQDFTKTMLRDGFMHRLVQDLSFDTMFYRPVIVFVNGEFWGIMNLRDRFDDHYLETHYGVPRNQIDFLEQNAEISEGENTHFLAMRNYISSNNMANPTHFDHVSTMMDTYNFGEYHMAQIYFNNRDWPHNNIEYWRKRTASYEPDAPYGHDGRWRWMLKDTDFGFGWNLGTGAVYYNMLGYVLNPNGINGNSWPNIIFRSLIQNPKYRKWFITRYADLLNSHFHPDRVLAVLDHVSGTIEPHIQEHIERWGYNEDRWEMPRNKADWDSNIDLMRHFATYRTEEIRKQMILHFNLQDIYTVTVERPEAEQGYVQVNSLPLTSQTHGVDMQGDDWQGVYFKGMDLTLVAKPAEGYIFQGWTGDVTSTADSIIIQPTKNITVIPIFAQSTSLGDETANLPLSVELLPNYPNPFNPETTIRWEQSQTASVRIRVYDSIGRQVATLTDATFRAGSHSLKFDASALGSGIYLVRLEADGTAQVQKVTLLR